ncbi:MAG: MATE family efflux transporter [Bacteriovoracaceae bacterium]|nr:MATE family efflux transporter [Bacteriovoracaceae bacterium]
MKLTGLRLKDLWWFSVPSIVSSVFEPLASIVDTALVGRLSTEALGSLAISVAIFNAITWMFNFLVHASTQTVADYEASKDSQLLRGRIKIALIVATFVGVACSVVLWFPQRFWFELAGGKSILWDQFQDYYRPRTIFHLFTVLSITSLSILRGYGRLRLVLVLMIISTGANIFLSWLFLYPMEMGLKGAAYGTIAAHFLTLILAVYFVVADPRVGLKFLRAKTDKSQWLKFGKSSIDLFGRSFTLTVCFFTSTRLASQLGLVALGAHQVLLQVWLLASFFLDGLAISGNILGARYYFAGQFKRTAFVFKQLLILGLCVGGVFTILYLLGWEAIGSLFTKDALVMKEMGKVKVLVILSQAISAVAFVFDGLLFGLSGFSYLRKHMIIGALFIYFPLALMSLKDPSLVWIWSGLVCLNVYRGLTGYYFVKTKVWRALS